jgi:hypothetical protein
MKVIKNNILHSVPVIKQKVDDLSDLPYIPSDPLPLMLFVLLQELNQILILFQMK